MFKVSNYDFETHAMNSFRAFALKTEDLNNRLDLKMSFKFFLQ